MVRPHRAFRVSGVGVRKAKPLPPPGTHNTRQPCLTPARSSITTRNTSPKPRWQASPGDEQPAGCHAQTVVLVHVERAQLEHICIRSAQISKRSRPPQLKLLRVVPEIAQSGSDGDRPVAVRHWCWMVWQLSMHHARPPARPTLTAQLGMDLLDVTRTSRAIPRRLPNLTS